MKKIFSILLFSLSFHLVQAQSFANYPEKNITIIVGFPPGTATDTIARILAERFTNKLGKSFIIENSEENLNRNYFFLNYYSDPF